MCCRGSRGGVCSAEGLLCAESGSGLMGWGPSIEEIKPRDCRLVQCKKALANAVAHRMSLFMQSVRCAPL